MVQSQISTDGVSSQKGGKDFGYTAIMQATNAMEAYLNNNYQEVISRSSTTGETKYVAEWIFPIIIFDGMLLEAYLNVSGTIVLDEIEMGLITWNYPTVKNLPIRVINYQALNKFIRSLQQSIQTIESYNIE